MNDETIKKLKEHGLTFNILSFGIDIFDRRERLVFHGHEVEIVHWLYKSYGE